MYSRHDAIFLMNQYGSMQIPFLFYVSYDQSSTFIAKTDEVDQNRVLYNFCGHTNESDQKNRLLHQIWQWQIYPPKFETYKHSFKIVHENILKGNSYLTNLTCETPIETNLDLNQICMLANAKYKLWVKDQFVMFSPEIFIRVKGNKIFSYPMKGTIDAKLPKSMEMLINDKKEAAEHATITDLIRNDLSRIANQVRVKRYRYVEKLETNHGPILQTSTEIEGLLPTDMHGQIGDMIFSLLPAGSITGAPKKMTTDIISKAETYERGFYSGIAGIFDGENIDSCVMIRFVEQQKNGLVYKSGGGITAMSNVKAEYEEMKQKIYIPVTA
ncbi:MAG: aminodeoxychorismate synthase component I [Bacteroidaceae bacterium]|nr:aminodeoxychorismate synthase component I [Bacteroidaceae bacterium]